MISVAAVVVATICNLEALELIVRPSIRFEQHDGGRAHPFAAAERT